MNSVNLIGRLANKPSIRRPAGGEATCAFTVAVGDARSKEDRSDFVRVRVSGEKAGLCERYLSKGLLVGVAGRLRSESYMDSEGAMRCPLCVVADDVQFLQWPGGDSGESAQAAKAGAETEGAE
jgi:single-strand DNA-binding protein